MRIAIVITLTMLAIIGAGAWIIYKVCKPTEEYDGIKPHRNGKKVMQWTGFTLLLAAIAVGGAIIQHRETPLIDQSSLALFIFVMLGGTIITVGASSDRWTTLPNWSIDGLGFTTAAVLAIVGACGLRWCHGWPTVIVIMEVVSVIALGCFGLRWLTEKIIAGLEYADESLNTKLQSLNPSGIPTAPQPAEMKEST